MTIARMLPAAWLLLVACGPSNPPAQDTPMPTGEPTVDAPPTSAPTADATAAPTAAPDTASFAAAPSFEIAGSTVRLTYEGATYTLSEAALIPTGKSYTLRFQQPAADGAHIIKFMPKELKAGEPAKLEGKGSLFLQVTDGKNTDGKWKLVDITSKCGATGTITVAEIPKPGGKAKGSVDVTITCEGVEDLKEHVTLKGDFSQVPLGK
jgi:hypothetical protein